MPDPNETLNRRAFCRWTAALAVGSVAATRPAAADHFDHQPDHVTLSFDRSFLERYRPRLDLSAVKQNPDDTVPGAMFGWKASSPEHETDVAVFFAEYPYQQGILPTGSDSHFGDHEPFYVFVDATTGEVREVVYSAYHWLRGRTPTPSIYNQTHVEATVVSPWHQYALGSVTDGEYVAVEDLTSAFPDWLNDEDWHDHLEPGVVVNPWRMAGADGRQHWWREGSDGVSANQLFYSSLLWVSNTTPFVDIGGASASDSTA